MKQGDFIWLVVFCGVSALLIIPGTHQLFISSTQNHPYFMGFGELPSQVRHFV